MRDLERRLVAVALDQGGAIAPREQRDCERDRQEGHRRHGRARPACKPDCCHARGEPAAAAVCAEARERRQDPGYNQSRGDRDEAGEKQEQQRRVLSARQLLLVGGAEEERDCDDQHGCRSDQVDRPDTAAAASRQRHGDPDERGCDDTGRGREPEAACRQDAFAKHGSGRCSGQTGDDSRDRNPSDPSEDDAGERNGARLETAQQPELPALRAEPREPSPSGLEIATHPTRREDRESQQQDGPLSADEQQARTRDVRRALRLAQLFDGNVDAERRRALRELDASALSPGDELVDLPEAWRARPERPHPGVGAVRAREQRSIREGCPTLGDDERRRWGPVVLARVAELGGNGRVCDRRVAGEEEVAEELSRAQVGSAHLDEAQAGSVRKTAAAAQPEHLAALGSAGSWQPAGTQDHVLRDAVHRRDADEPSGNGALTEEDEGRRLPAIDTGVGILDCPIERREPLAGVAGNAEPHRAYGTLRGRDSLDRLRHRAIRRDRHARQHSGEHGRGDDEPEDRDERAAVPPAETLPREPGDSADGPHRDVFRRSRYAAVFVRFPQIDIEHQVEEAFLDAS